jgi:GTP diphosphokinase / guanosine-3',5'-bis(diphosphate) 3'-diphosphatase
MTRSIDTTLTRTVLKFATDAHEGQERIAGVPYIIHPYAVAALVTLHTDVFAEHYLSAYLTALLHDVLEDTKATAEDILTITNNQLVLDAVVALTKNEELGNDRAQLADSLARAQVVGDWVVWIKAFDRIDNLNFALCPPARTDEQIVAILEETKDIQTAVGATKGGESIIRLLNETYDRYRQFARM